jgi:hypothetical protein
MLSLTKSKPYNQILTESSISNNRINSLDLDLRDQL